MVPSPGAFHFNTTPTTHDMRICGTLASLVGVEDALAKESSHFLDMALRRARMMYGVIMSIGGIPFIYMGEECGVLNDYSYSNDADKRDDSRWVHRIPMNWDQNSTDLENSAGPAFFEIIQTLAMHRKRLTALGGTHLEVLPTSNPHLLLYRRTHCGQSLVVCANFSEQTIALGSDSLPSDLKAKSLANILGDGQLSAGTLLLSLWSPMVSRGNRGDLTCIQGWLYLREDRGARRP